MSPSAMVSLLVYSFNECSKLEQLTIHPSTIIRLTKNTFQAGVFGLGNGRRRLQRALATTGESIATFNNVTLYELASAESNIVCVDANSAADLSAAYKALNQC